MAARGGGGTKAAGTWARAGTWAKDGTWAKAGAAARGGMERKAGMAKDRHVQALQAVAIQNGALNGLGGAGAGGKGKDGKGGKGESLGLKSQHQTWCQRGAFRSPRKGAAFVACLFGMARLVQLAAKVGWQGPQRTDGLPIGRFRHLANAVMCFLNHLEEPQLLHLTLGTRHRKR